MAKQFLIHVDLNALDDSPEGSIGLQTISFLDRVHFAVDSANVSGAKEFLKSYCKQLIVYCDVTALGHLSDVISILHNGATKIFVTENQLRGIVETRSLEDLSRLVVSIPSSRCSGDPLTITAEVKRHIQELAGSTDVGIAITEVYDWSLLNTIEKCAEKEGFPTCYVILTGDAWEDYEKALSGGHIPIIPATKLTVEPQRNPNHWPIWRLVTSAIHSDRSDGLFPTVVTDQYGVCLGLVYSNHESIEKAICSGSGVYWSRSRNKLWIKGAESGDTQDLISIKWDCDADALQFVVRQKGDGFCHLKTSTCFGSSSGLARLQKTLSARRSSAPEGSYTARLFKEPKLLEAKIMEEASELCEAKSAEDIAAEAADLFYFAMTRCTAAGVGLEDIEHCLNLKSMKTTRRPGNAKPQWAEKVGLKGSNADSDSKENLNGATNGMPSQETLKEAASVPKESSDPAGTIKGNIQMQRYLTAETDQKTLQAALQRPSQRSTDDIMNIIKPIIQEIRTGGDAAVLKYTHKFEKATSLTSPVLRAPFPESLMQLPPETIEAIDVSFENIRRFHAAQQDQKPLLVETMPGIVCSRFSRPIESVGLYVPGGTAVLPSTALMLGVPAMVAGCGTIVMASPPRSDGTITPEIVYVAHKVGAHSIVLAGGAQAVASMAYGTESIAKVDKILGPGNQFVTAGKMIVSNDTTASVSIDMPAGPSEVLVIADKTASPAFVASDLLSQAEHGTDSQVVLIAVNLSEDQLGAIETELNAQANALPRVDIVRGAIEHSVTLVVKDIAEAMQLSNQYAPEHLILQVEDAEKIVDMVQNAGSVFIGPWTPESVGDYSAGVNHSLPTYGYAKQYSGVNLSSFTKHITSSNLTKEGLKNVSGAVMQLAKVEQLEAHRRAVSIRLEQME